jgi:hypothetical protein
VSKPTTFPMVHGNIGLMGEKGPEAIMPLRRTGDGYAVHTVGPDGPGFMKLGRDSAGRLAVQPANDISAPAPSAYAAGGIFDGSRERYTYKFADGAVFSQSGSYGGSLMPQDAKNMNARTQAQGGPGITVVQNITTPDVAGFRRAKAAIAADIRSGLGTIQSKA